MLAVWIMSYLFTFLLGCVLVNYQANRTTIKMLKSMLPEPNKNKPVTFQF